MSDLVEADVAGEERVDGRGSRLHHPDLGDACGGVDERADGGAGLVEHDGGRAPTDAVVALDRQASPSPSTRWR